MRKKIFAALAALLCLCSVLLGQDTSVKWSVSASDAGDGLYELVFNGVVDAGWHTYGTGSEFSAPSLSLEGCEPVGSLYDLTDPVIEDGDPVFHGTARLGQKVRAASGAKVSGSLTYQACTGGMCLSPQDWDFDVKIPGGGAAGSLWALILEAILWGLAMLLTPCVFPMVPMTV